MKFSDIDKEKLKQIEQDSIGFVIAGNKKEHHSLAIVGDFNTETLITIGLSIIREAKNNKPDLKQEIDLMVMMKLAEDTFDDIQKSDSKSD